RNSEVDAQAVAASVSRVRARVNEAAATSGRAPGSVRILAAVKYVDAAACAALVAAGIEDLAENRLASLAEKQAAAHGATWHFIGRLQSREAASVAAQVDVIHTLCSDSAARRLAAVDGPTPARLLVQVNVDDDPAKDGVPAADVEAFLDALPAPLVVSGFMTMPALTADPAQSRRAFAELRELRDRLATTFAGRHELAELSMGTSQDYEVAIEEGATHVRLGRILFAGAE
ncbi:MAG: pyridoxal phosphate enzyme YggS family, partial [Thermoleophilia bacterium]|nr:pyridoxal phosphate enzyme YggS family [Thermoleophilia bacterium]